MLRSGRPDLRGDVYRVGANRGLALLVLHRGKMHASVAVGVGNTNIGFGVALTGQDALSGDMNDMTGVNLTITTGLRRAATGE